MDESWSWLFAPPAIILQFKLFIDDLSNIAPSAQGENTSQSNENASSIQ